MCKNDFCLLLQYLLIFKLIDHNGSYAYYSASKDRSTEEVKFDTNKELNWTKFFSIDEMMDWMREVAFLNENKYHDINRVKVGRTYENRSIYGITMTSKNGKKRPGVILEAGMEGPRDALVVSASNWMVNQILKEKDENSIWHQFDYLYIPIVNVDGYRYSVSPEGDIRNVNRKSRRPIKHGILPKCYGVHLNHNWDADWHLAYGNLSRCHEFYPGPEFFSEPETQSLSQYYYKNNQKYDIFISLQSEGQLILFSSPKKSTEHYRYLKKTASKAAVAAWRIGRTEKLFTDLGEYETGSFDDYKVTIGSSARWHHQEFNSTLTFIIKLRAKINNLLVPDCIIPSGKELMAIVETMLKSYNEQEKETEEMGKKL